MTLSGRLRSSNLLAPFDQAITGRDLDALRMILRQACGPDTGLEKTIDGLLAGEWPVGIELARRFDVLDWAEALDILTRVRLPFLDAPNRTSERARVKLAIIKLASGTIAGLRRWAADAATDWRDTLVAAGWANVGWRQAIVKEGFLLPDEDEP